jgi:hypothetical protein
MFREKRDASKSQNANSRTPAPALEKEEKSATERSPTAGAPAADGKAEQERKPGYS